MATRQEAQEHIIDLILDFIITNAVDAPINGNSIDLSSYRRYIDPTTGQITVDENAPADSSFVLYEKDFRESFDQDLLSRVDEIIDNCVDVTGVTGEDYNILQIGSNMWHYVPGGTTCDGFEDTFCFARSSAKIVLFQRFISISTLDFR